MSVTIRLSCSEVPHQLCISMEGRDNLASLYVHRVALRLWKPGSLSLSEQTPHLSAWLSVSLPVCLCRVLLWLLTVCALFYPSFTSLPQTFLYILLTLYLSITPLSLCHSSSFLSNFFDPPPPSFGLGSAAAHRSDRDRWSRRTSGLYSFRPETAWYCCCCCCWRGALTGCPQVQQCPIQKT